MTEHFTYYSTAESGHVFIFCLQEASGFIMLWIKHEQFLALTHSSGVLFMCVHVLYEEIQDTAYTVSLSGTVCAHFSGRRAEWGQQYYCCVSSWWVFTLFWNKKKRHNNNKNTLKSQQQSSLQTHMYSTWVWLVLVFLQVVSLQNHVLMERKRKLKMPIR